MPTITCHGLPQLGGTRCHYPPRPTLGGGSLSRLYRRGGSERRAAAQVACVLQLSRSHPTGACRIAYFDDAHTTRPSDRRNALRLICAETSGVGPHARRVGAGGIQGGHHHQIAWLYTVRYKAVWGVFGICSPMFAHIIGEFLVNSWLRFCYGLGVWAGQMPFWWVLRGCLIGCSLVVEPPLA